MQNPLTTLNWPSPTDLSGNYTIDNLPKLPVFPEIKKLQSTNPAVFSTFIKSFVRREIYRYYGFSLPTTSHDSNCTCYLKFARIFDIHNPSDDIIDDIYRYSYDGEPDKKFLSL